MVVLSVVGRGYTTIYRFKTKRKGSNKGIISESILHTLSTFYFCNTLVVVREIVRVNLCMSQLVREFFGF